MYGINVTTIVQLQSIKKNRRESFFYGEFKAIVFFSSKLMNQSNSSQNSFIKAIRLGSNVHATKNQNLSSNIKKLLQPSVQLCIYLYRVMSYKKKGSTFITL